MKAELMNTFGKLGFALKKHSPEILAVTGTIGVITSVVLACKATRKVDDVLETHKEKMEKVHEEQDEAVVKKETTKVYAQTGLEFAKLYGPSATLCVLSVGALLGSNQILRKRNASLAAAYMTVDQAFRKYRDRVAERFGEDTEKQIFYNTKTEEIEEIVTDDKGKEKKVKSKVDVADPSSGSPYARYLTYKNTDYSEQEDFVRNQLSLHQEYLNHKLRACGHLTLNEAYDTIGFSPTAAGLVVGWVYDPKVPNGDNYVQLSCKRAMVLNEFGEKEKCYIIDFNVDGDIYSPMKERGM